MSKDLLPLVVGDISSFARALRTQLEGREHAPGHVEMLNLLVKAAGYRNFQHYRAAQDSIKRSSIQPELHENPAAGLLLHTLPTGQPDAAQGSVLDSAEGCAAFNSKRVQQVARYFDGDKRLIRWPKKFTQRMVCLWVMWSRMPARTSMTEREISEWLAAQHLFGDHALLRRELVDRGLVTRTADGRQYYRLEQQPPAEAMAVFERLRRA